MNEDSSANFILEVTPRVIHFIRTTARTSSDLTVAQFRVLARLSHGPATNAELAERQGISPPTMCRIIEGLEKKGLIQKTREKMPDRRQIQLCLTKKGQVRFDSVIKVAKKTVLEKIDTLSEQEKLELRKGLAILTQLFP